MLALGTLTTKLEADRGAVLVDMLVSENGTSNMWVNDQTQSPMTAKLLPAVRKVYEFKGVAEDIRYVRIDPLPGINGGVIRIFSIEIQSPTGTKQRLGPSELATWQVANGSRAALTDSYIEYVSAQNIILTTEATFKVSMFYPTFIHQFVRVVSDLSKFTIIVGLCFLCLVLVSAWSRSWVHVGIVVGMVVGLIGLSQNVATADFGSVSVEKAVGLAAFSGHSLAPNSLFIALSAMLAATVAGAAHWASRSKIAPPYANGLADWPRPNWWQFGAVLALVASMLFPDVLANVPRHAMLWGGMYVPQWDSDNAVTWAYMINSGYLPFKDFWYPYALSFAFDLISPWGGFLQYCVLLGLFGAFFYFVSIVSRSTFWVGTFLIVLMLFGGLPNHNVLIFPQPERHLFPFVICLTYVAASGADRFRWMPIWPFWLVTCLGLVFEPSQVAYAALGVALVLIFDVVNKPVLERVKIGRRLIRDFAVPAAFLCILVSALAIGGVIRNVSDLYLEMGTISSYMAVPTSLHLGPESITERSFLFIVMPFILLALGIAEQLLTRDPSNYLPKAVMAVGAVGIMQLQKHGVRPIDWALFYSSTIGVVLYSVLLSRLIGKKITLLLGAMVAMSVAVFIQVGAISHSWQQVLNVAERFSDAAHVLTMNDNQLSAYRAGRFSSDRLKAFAEEDNLLNTLKSRVGYMPTFYSLPDAPLLYVLAGVNPPYQINGFNMSPIFEQVKMVEYLRAKKVENVIIEPGKMYLDSVPNIVRLPLLYDYITGNYVPDFATSRFAVLRQRKQTDPPALDAWVSILGGDVNLGHLPTFSNAPAFPILNCLSDCEDVLRISATVREHEQTIAVPFRVAGRTLTVSFVAIPGKAEYWIKLSRIWFWAAQYDAAWVAQLANVMPNGVRAEVFHAKLNSPEVLY
jgi:hypothetical protein